MVKTTVWMVGIAMALAPGALARGQMLQGRWVDQTEAAIDKLRKVDLRVIVLTRDGRTAPGSDVHIRMLRHAFPFGVALNSQSFASPASPDADWSDRPVWRGFNAVSLDAVTGWAKTQSQPGKPDFQIAERMLRWSESRQLIVRWGGVIPADKGMFPPWALDLDDQKLAEVLDGYVREVTARFGSRVAQFDVYTRLIDDHHVEDRLGDAMVRRLFQTAGASRAARCGRFDDSFTGVRHQRMVRHVAARREKFIPLDMVAVGARVKGTIIHTRISLSLQWLAALDLPIVICDLEVAGPTPTAAAINLETMLRTLFAHQAVEGIWFSGIEPATVTDPAAALMDDQGQPTGTGRAFDGLVRHQWWTDVEATPDELANVRRRVFAGQYEISVKLPDATEARSRVWLKPSQVPPIVMLQPLEVTTPTTKAAESSK